MDKITIIRENGIEEIMIEEDIPKLIFGESDAHSQKKERKSIGRALVETGLDVYATNTPWPNDAYVLNNGLVLPEIEFRDLAHSGNYLFGDGFILVSTAIRDDLEKRLKDSEHFRRFLEGKEIVFVPPYSGIIMGMEGSGLKPRHIDLTMGYIPNAKVLSVDEKHYRQEKRIFDDLVRRFGISVNITDHENYYPNNFFAFSDNGHSTVIANRYNNPLSNRSNGFIVIETDIDILNLPGKFFGSVKCAVNITPTTKLWDALGIEYRRWGVNPQQANYAPR